MKLYVIFNDDLARYSKQRIDISEVDDIHTSPTTIIESAVKNRCRVTFYEVSVSSDEVNRIMCTFLCEKLRRVDDGDRYFIAEITGFFQVNFSDKGKGNEEA